MHERGIFVELDDRSGVEFEERVADVRRALAGVPGVRVVAASPPPAAPATAPIRASGVVVDLARHRVWVDGRPVNLSFREHALLSYLVEHQGEVHDRRRLLSALVGETDGDPISERTIDVYLQRLRRRLEPYGDIVRTVRGRGYRLDPHPDVTVVPAIATEG
ncbi:MAG: winged helix-turn-helix domain-containing protein [Protaetiibacter sp.]